MLDDGIYIMGPNPTMGIQVGMRPQVKGSVRFNLNHRGESERWAQILDESQKTKRRNFSWIRSLGGTIQTTN